MKKTILLIVIAFSRPAFSQNISVQESKEKFSTGFQPSVSTSIFGNNKSEVIDEWKKILKDFKHEKVKDNDDEVFGDNIVIKDWGNNTVDVYSKFEEDKKDKVIKMSVAVDLGGKYLDTDEKEKLEFVKKITKEFAIKMTKLPLENEIKHANKLLNKSEDQEKKLGDDKKSLLNDIEDYKNKIKKAEDDIKKNEAEQSAKKLEIETQQKALSELKKRLDAVN